MDEKVYNHLIDLSIIATSDTEVRMQDEFSSVQQWASVGVPAIVGKSTTLDALFVSYNMVGNRRPGAQGTGKQGLRVLVQNGYADPSQLARTIFAFGDSPEVVSRGVRLMETAAKIGQRTVEDGVAETLAENKSENILLVLYAGLSAFAESVRFARTFKSQHPTAHIVVLTCDCDFGEKARTLLHLRELGQVNDLVVTGKCGGEEDMDHMLRAVVKAWPGTR